MRLVRLARSSILFVVVLALGVLTALLWLWVGFYRLPTLITKITGSFGWQATSDISKPIIITHAIKMINLSSKPRLPACGSLASVWLGFRLVLIGSLLMA